MRTPSDKSFIGDLDGINISEKNEYSEIRHHYFVWKNLVANYDYVGFEHYRRMFFVNLMNHRRLQKFSPELANMSESFDVDQKHHEVQASKELYYTHVEMREAYDSEDIERFKVWLSKFDVVVPRMWHLHDRPDLESEWKNSGLPPAMWELFIESMGKCPGFLPLPNHPIRTSNHNCIFIMRTELFCDYMENLFSCLEELDIIKRGKIDNFPRQWAYIAEKTLNYYILAQKKLNPLFSVTHLPLVVRTNAGDIY